MSCRGERGQGDHHEHEIAEMFSYFLEESEL